MTENNDYRQLLDEKFNNIDKILELHHNETHQQLKTILIQTTKTNGRCSKLEDDVVVLKLKYASHGVDCPQKDRIKDIEKGLDKYKEAQNDINFMAKHPKFALFIIVCAVIGTLFSWGLITENKDTKDYKAIELQLDEQAETNTKLKKQLKSIEEILSEMQNKTI